MVETVTIILSGVFFKGIASLFRLHFELIIYTIFLRVRARLCVENNRARNSYFHLIAIECHILFNYLIRFSDSCFLNSRHACRIYIIDIFTYVAIFSQSFYDL